MNEQPKRDGRPLFRILAAVVAFVCVALLAYSIVTDGEKLVALLIFIFLGLPMMRLAATGYFRRKR